MLWQHLLRWPAAMLTLEQDHLACKFRPQFHIVANLSSTFPVTNQTVIHSQRFWRRQIRRRQYQRETGTGGDFSASVIAEKTRWRPQEIYFRLFSRLFTYPLIVGRFKILKSSCSEAIRPLVTPCWVVMTIKSENYRLKLQQNFQCHEAPQRSRDLLITRL